MNEEVMNEKEKKVAKPRAISMRLLMYIAWRNLVNKKLRTFLTIFGVIIGIGAIFFLLSFGLGLRNLVTDQVIGDQSIKSINVTTTNSKIVQLNNDAINKMNQFPHVTGIGKLFSFPGNISYNGGETDTVTYGIDTEYQKLSSFNMIAGRGLEDTDTTTIVVNHSALVAIGIDSDEEALGQKLSIIVPLQNVGANKPEIKEEFTIVGVIENGSGSEIYIPAGLMEGAGVPNYTEVKVIADATDSVTTLRKQIESQGFETVSPIDTLEEINQIFKFFTIILIGFGAIGMIVSVLGMFNTLTISLLERTKEIGLMMALGGRNRDMRKLFIFEAVLLSFSGALIGIGFAVITGQFANILMNQFARKRGVTQGFALFSTPLWAVGALTLFMVVVGLMVVFFPARRAQKINPIDALRRE